MCWRYLGVLFNRPMMSAIVAVSIIPIVADLMRTFGLNYSALIIPILGGLVFWVSFSLYSWILPDIINKHSDQNDFVEWALESNVNIFDDLPYASSLPENKIINYLGDKFDILYPIEKGLKYSRSTCIREYAVIEYDLRDKSMPIRLYLISILAGTSIIMINWLAIERVFRVVWG